MKKALFTFIAFSFIFISAASQSSAQITGTRVEADIPFDFTVGKKTFNKGKYDLKVGRMFGEVYSVALTDKAGRTLFRTTAIGNGSTKRNGSEMQFVVVDGQRYLEKIRTPESGYQFRVSVSDSRVAKAERESVPTSGPQF